MQGCSCDLLKTSCKVAPVIKVAHIFWWRHDIRDDVTTIEKNRQVRVNIDATLLVIFRIASERKLQMKLNVTHKREEQALM